MTTEMTEMKGAVVRKFALGKIRMRGNARTVFDRVELEELAASLRDSNGPLQLPVGYLIEGDGECEVELVFGERRLRAMELNREVHGARWDGLMVRVIERCSEQEFLKWSLAENLQRVNLKPSEMGAWLARMMAVADPSSGQALWTKRSLAEEIGKDENFIILALNAMRGPERVRVALDRGRCVLEVAGLIGSLPEAVQEAAADAVVFGMTGPMKLEQARQYIATHFRRDFRTADFNPVDGTLLPEVGSCHGCEWWGGNREDVGGQMRSQVCLNPSCFARKQEAAAVLERDRLMMEGGDLVVLDAEAGAGLFEDHSGRLSPTSGFVDLKQRPDAYFLVDGERNRDSVKSWGKILEEDCPTVTVVWDGKGRKHELVETGPAVVAAMGGKFGSLFRSEAGKGFLSADEKSAQGRVKSSMEREGRLVLLEGAREFFGGLSGVSLSRECLVSLLGLAMEQGLKGDDFVFLCEVLEPGMERSSMSYRGILELVDVKGLDEAGIFALLVLVLQVRSLRYEGFESWVEEGPLEVLCGVAGFDPAAWVKVWKRRRAAAEREARSGEGV